MATRALTRPQPRRLTQEEIDHIIDSLDYVTEKSYLTPELSRNIKAQQTEHVRRDLAEVVIRPDKIPELIVMINQALEKALINASTPVGARAAQILASTNTQKALDLFNGKESLEGDSFSRVADCARKMSGVTTTVHFTKRYDNVNDIIREYGSTFVYTTVRDLAIMSGISTSTESHYFHSLYVKVNDDLTLPTSTPMYLRIPLNKLELARRGLSTFHIAKAVNNSLRVTCIPSPDDVCELHVFSDRLDIKLPAGKSIEEFPRAIQMYFEYTLSKEVLDAHVCGIQGITDWTFVREDSASGASQATGGESWGVLLMGGNIFQVMAVENVDPQRVFSTSMWEMYDAFGIEGVYYMIMKVLGGDSNTATHLMLLASSITYDGYPRGMNRFGLNASAHITEPGLRTARLTSACGTGTAHDNAKYASLCKGITGRDSTNALACATFEAPSTVLPKAATRRSSDNASTAQLGAIMCGARRYADFEISQRMDIE